MKQVKLYLSIFFFSALLITGCKSKKTVIGGALETKSHSQIINDVLDKEIKYTSISTKGSIEMKTGSSSTKLSAQYKIIKDSIIQVSVLAPLIKTEVLRINFTPDSIIVLDRYKKQYVAEKITDIKDVIQFNYANLQALLTNRLFLPGANDVSAADFKKYEVSSTGDVYQLQTADKNKVAYNFAVDASDHIVSTLIFSKKNNVTIQWSYDEFTNDNGLIYPQKMEAKIDALKSRLDIGIEYSKLEIDKPITVSTSISQKYNRVSIKDFIKSYMKSK